MSFVAFSPLPCALGIAVYWIALGMLGLTQRADREAGRMVYAAGALGGLLLAVTAAWSLGDAPMAVQLPLGLPGLPFHLRLDSLSAFFLLLLGLAVAGISLFATGYFTSGSTADSGLTCLHYHLFLAAMVGAVLVGKRDLKV